MKTLPTILLAATSITTAGLLLDASGPAAACAAGQPSLIAQITTGQRPNSNLYTVTVDPGRRDLAPVGGRDPASPDQGVVASSSAMFISGTDESDVPPMRQAPQFSMAAGCI